MRGAQAGSRRRVMSSREELRALADAMLEGSITPEEMDRLAALLRNNPEAQSFYLAVLDLEAGLHLEMRGGLRATGRRRRPVLFLAGAAAAALLLAGLAYWGLRPSPAPASLSRVHQAT